MKKIFLRKSFLLLTTTLLLVGGLFVANTAQADPGSGGGGGGTDSVNLILTVPSATTITRSALIPETSGGTAVSNAAVDTAIISLAPIPVTLANTGDIASANVRISPINAGSHIQLWARDTSGNWFDINVTGWIDSTGKSFPANTSPITTNVYAISDTTGDYPLTVNLVDVTNPSLPGQITSKTGTVTVNAPAPTQIPAERLPTLGTLTDVTVTSTLGKVTIVNGLPVTIDAVSNPSLFAELEAQHPGEGSTVGYRYVGFMIAPPIVEGYTWYQDDLKEVTPGHENDLGWETLGGSGTSVLGTELWEPVAVKSGDIYNRYSRTPKNYEITWVMKKADSPNITVTELFTVEQTLKVNHSSSGSRPVTPAIPATPAVPGISPAVPATPAVPAGKVLGAEKFNFTKFLKFKAGSYKVSLQGAEVIELQNFLTTLGYTLVSDGKFGPLTEGAVIKFQIAKGLKGDGVVGALTREALNK